MFDWVKKITPGRLLAGYILISLLVGLIIVPDYGISMDERRESMRAETAIRAYSFDGEVNYEKIGLAQIYGTGQSVIFQLADDFFQPILHISPRVVAHYLYFVTFQAAVISLYFLGRRFFDDWAALSVSMLFGLQPLYFGHAFINPKDIPLMAAFLSTVVLGLYLADQILASLPTPSVDDIKQVITEDWGSFKKRNKTLLIVLNLVLLSSLVFPHSIIQGMNLLLARLYISPPSSIGWKIFVLFARSANTVPLEDYQQKLTSLYSAYIGWLVAVAIGIQLVFIAFPKSVKSMLTLRGFSDAPFSDFIRSFRNPRLLIAAAVWGLCLSTRMIGVAAGGLVGLYFLLRGRKRAVIPLLVYCFVALAALVVFWPYLWYSGLSGLFNSLLLLGDFPVQLSILFNGRFYTGNDLPASYLPTLLAIQFTLPAVVLAFCGIGIALTRWIKSGKEWQQLLILFAWFFIPFTYVILAHPNLYHNFRQLLFITPPLFIFAGFTIDAVFKRIKINWLKIILMGSLLIPGLISIGRLHPYQYVYYNELVGGVNGAFRRYDLDYWMTSIKEATEYANQNLPEGTVINGWYAGSNYIELYLREDIQLVSHREFYGPRGPGFDYVMLPTWADYDLRHYKYGEDVYQVSVGDAVLMVVRKVK
jgi:hypothetical protein